METMEMDPAPAANGAAGSEAQLVWAESMKTIDGLLPGGEEPVRCHWQLAGPEEGAPGAARPAAQPEGLARRPLACRPRRWGHPVGLAVDGGAGD